MSTPDFANIENAEYIDRMYRQFRTDPDALDSHWHAFFAGFEFQGNGRSVSGTPSGQPVSGDRSVSALTHAYRSLGHRIADLDPLGYKRPPNPLLDIEHYGFTEEDLDTETGRGDFLGETDGTLRDLIEKLRQTYSGSIGVEYTNIPHMSQRDWLQRRMEPVLNRPDFTRDQCEDLFRKVLAAESLEQFIHTKYLGHKRFSIEGAESLIPLLGSIVETGAEHGVEEVVMGMAHRGRLNVLAHLMQKPYEIMLSEFAGAPLPQHSEGSGDVKYHMGYSCDYATPSGRKVHLSLSPNPSHLELVNPVIEGIVYAKQEARGDRQCEHVVPILIHGDSAFCGQGIISEGLCMGQLEGYDTGGTVHVIVNNQLGFTADPWETRFTSYPSDVAKSIEAPVFHVNGDDPEAVVHAARIAMAYRQAFHADVILDLWCYRRHGHNESDDPMFTQPLRSETIKQHPTTATIYAERLVDAGVLNTGDVDRVRREVREPLDEAYEVVHTFEGVRKERAEEGTMPAFGGLWSGLGPAGKDWQASTGVSREMIDTIAERATRVPEGFNVYRKIARLANTRKEMATGKEPMDWGCAEMLAFGSLLMEGTPVRLSGQDCRRGTFSHRHAVWSDVKTNEKYFPLRNLSNEQGHFTVLNSPLSELAVLGFEYGISSADPRALVIWEAQFGDFANMAQPIVDQFISAAESKWQRMSGLTMLLPHGFEGQGPEHSSARIERYLALCAEDNMQVCVPSLPGQYFHMLRRQMHRKFRKPLIAVMPKSLLRHPLSTSTVEDLVEGEFRNVIDDPDQPAPTKVARLVFCSGKVFFDLLEARRERKLKDVALVRIEQLNPFPFDAVSGIIERYSSAEHVIWAQEEPQNMGGWDFTEPKIRKLLEKGKTVAYRGRRPTASTATGIHSKHVEEQNTLVDATLVG